ncbi:hypothetical protein D9611_001672 [Ephemerocybe angulata]|uniref:YEATS domain-containing protein n=1 Tax=Ephemerocybe angulata TaxID=980116 RepID=A0A8H5FLZ0_9AGAR|nr:hypothetical protein D9611_001672 [Tulosesus angulatus]
MSKRRKLSEECSPALQAALPDIATDIDTEISIRARLAETLQARIDWALALQSVLRDSGKGYRTTSESIQQLATETLINAEAPAQALFATPYTSSCVPSPSQVHAIPTSFQSPAVPYRRPPPRQKPAPGRGKPSFLYVQTQTQGGPAVTPYLLLRCPVCARTAFSSLQGLLNHARISHSIEWGTHEACIKACAVAEPELDPEAGSEVWLGPAAVRGLQDIFERAAAGQDLQGQGQEQAALVKVESEDNQDGLLSGPSQSSLHHGPGSANPSQSTAPADTANRANAALRKREIRVYDEDVNICDDTATTNPNTEGVPNKMQSRNAHTGSRRVWKMGFAPRHHPQPLSELSNLPAPTASEQVAGGRLKEGGEGDGKQEEREDKLGKDVHADAAPPTVSVPNTPAPSSSFSPMLIPSSKSRFHFTARVGVSDRSLFVNSVSTPEGIFTRKWMIAVDSPSYAIPISSILHSVSVSVAGSEGDAVYLPVPVVSAPPFVVLGMANAPFLARVEMRFNDIKEGQEPQITVVEQWVDLDPMKSAAVVLGEEQLLDIELDLRTEVKSAVKNTLPFESRRLWNDLLRLPLETSGHPEAQEEEQQQSEEYRLLVDTAKRFPLVQPARERERSQLQYPETEVPYKLVSTRAQFNNLIIGRQEAIKWGRARAIREYYFDRLRSAKLGIPEWSVADIYLWLEESAQRHEGGSAKVSQQQAIATSNEVKGKGASRNSKEENGGGWCGLCGFEEKYHQASESLKAQEGDALNSGEIQKVKVEDERATCAIIRNIIQPLPFANSNKKPRMEGPLSSALLGDQAAPTRRPNRELLQSVDPALLSFVEREVEGIPAFQLLTPPSPSDRRDSRSLYPLDECGSSKEQVESRLAPLALLTRVVHLFLKELVTKGVGQASAEKAAVLRSLGRGRRGIAAEVRAGQVRTMLTPQHVVQGVAGGTDG